MADRRTGVDHHSHRVVGVHFLLGQRVLFVLAVVVDGRIVSIAACNGICHGKQAHSRRRGSRTH